MTKIAGSGSICQGHGSPDPDPHQKGLDPQHWLTDTVPFSPIFVDTETLVFKTGLHV
jgi:hypothetical protein